MRFSTGGKARGPRGMIRCASGADSIVWMKEDDGTVILKDEWCLSSEMVIHFRAFWLTDHLSVICNRSFPL